jgi:hypothetical protein
MSITLTAVYRKVPEGYIGFVEELPGANTQGATIEEVRENLLSTSIAPSVLHQQFPVTEKSMSI